VSPLLTAQFRIVFRIIKFSAGAGTKLTQEFRVHEAYHFVFDATPMFFALVRINVLYPVQVLIGKESEFKSRKERKIEVRKNKISPLGHIIERWPLILGKTEGGRVIVWHFLDWPSCNTLRLS
jgi:RTA1 like protein